MHKLFKLKNLLMGVALLGLVLLPALGAFVAQAQTTPRGTDAPVGRVLQAATCNENDAVTIQVSPATPKIGSTVKFTGTVKSECQAKVGGTGNGGSMWLYHGEYTPSNTQFEAEIANGFTIAKEFPITPQLFSPGQHLVGVKMSYCAATFGEPVCLDFLGRITTTVEAAATTGAATLTGTVAQQVQFSTIREVFTLVYNAGGSGKVAAKIEFYCGNENPPVKRTQNIGQPINCDYEKKAGTYTFTATAVDASNNPIQGATFSKQITLTGNETNAVGVDTPGLGDLAFGGFELFIGWLLKLFSGALKYTILWIVGPFIEAVLSIHTYDDKFANVIYPAWEIFRNLGNIFFILSIVAIGVATVFRISGWAVKDLLVKLIVGAILINFSLSIAQSILGIADTVQNQFLYIGPDAQSGAIRQIVNHLFSTDIFSGTPGNLGGFGGILEQIMNFFLSFGSFIAFLGIAALLTVRVLFLWILLMLSPLPYIAMVLPISRSMSKKWWSEFGKWAFITPVMAFMLNLTALITVQTQKANIIQSLANTDPSKTDGVVSGVMFAFASNAIPLGFLYMTLKAATAFGSGASGFINKAAEKGVRAAFWPAAAAGAAIGAGATKVGVGAAAAAKNVGMLPFTAAALKYKQMGDKRQARFDNNTAGTWDRVTQGVSNALSVGDYAKAKRERLQDERKAIAKRREEKIKETEKRVLSWSGLQTGAQKVKLATNGSINPAKWSTLTNSNVQKEIDAQKEYQKVLTKEQKEALVKEKGELEARKQALENNAVDYTQASKADIQRVMEGLKEQIDEKTALQTQDVEKTNTSFQEKLKDLADEKTAAGSRVKDIDAQIAAKQAQLKSNVILGPDSKPALNPALSEELRNLESEKAVALANQKKIDQDEIDLKAEQVSEVGKVKQSYGDEIDTLSTEHDKMERAIKGAGSKEPIDISDVEISSLGAGAQAELSKAFAQAKVEEIKSLEEKIGERVKLDDKGQEVLDGRGNKVMEAFGGTAKRIADDAEHRAKAGISVGEDVTVDMLKESKARLLQSEQEMSKATLPESYLAARNRRQAVKAADARAPLEEYDYETWLRAFKDAQSRGDKNLSLNLLQKIQSEGDYPDALRRTGYSQTIEDSQRFMKEKIGSLGFSDKELLDIMKESDDRVKSSSPGLAGMVKIDEETGKRKLADAGAIGKLFDGAMGKGDGTLRSMWSKMGAPNVLSWDAKENGYALGPYFKEALSRLDPEDETAMLEFWKGLSAAGARQMTTDKGWLKDQPNGVKNLEAAIKAEITKKYQDKDQGDKRAAEVYQMIQAKSGQNRQASQANNAYVRALNKSLNQSIAQE